jgi:hypothetical protein
MQCAQEQAIGLITQYEEGEGGDDNGLNVSIKLRTENGSFDPIEDLINSPVKFVDNPPMLLVSVDISPIILDPVQTRNYDFFPPT